MEAFTLTTDLTADDVMTMVSDLKVVISGCEGHVGHLSAAAPGVAEQELIDVFVCSLARMADIARVLVDVSVSIGIPNPPSAGAVQ